MTIEFDPLSDEHELHAAGAVLNAFEGQEGRLIVTAHRFAIDCDVDDNVLADAYVTFLGYHGLGMPWVAVPVDDLPHALSVLVSTEMAYDVEFMDKTAARK